MRNYKIIKLLVLFFVFWVFPINASTFCPMIERNAEQAKLLRIAANVNLNSIYNEREADVLFDIRINNLHEKIKIFEKKEETFIYFDQANSRNQYVKKGYKSNQVVQFAIYPHNPKCIPDDEALLVKRVVLPPFNKYYKDPLCQGRENIPICFRWQKVDLEYEEFKQKMEQYEREQEKNDENEERTVDIFSLFDFVKKNYYYLFYGFFLVLIFLIYKKLKKKKDDFRL